MYKKQMTIQRIVCLLAVIAGALVFVYSLGFSTDLSDTLNWTEGEFRVPDETGKVNRKSEKVEFTEAQEVYLATQAFNKKLTYAGIGMILLGASLFITQTHVRRRYYIGNYVTSGLYVAGALGVTVWTSIAIHGGAGYKNAFLHMIDACGDKLAAVAKVNGKSYITSTFWFDLQRGVTVMLIVVAALVVANVVWKICLMKSEAKLLKEPQAVAQ